MTSPSSDPQWAARLVGQILDQQHGQGHGLQYTALPRRYSGQPHTCIVRHANGKPMAALQVADTSVPDMVARSCAQLGQVGALLAPDTALHVMQPMASGWAGGCAWALFPFGREISGLRGLGGLQRRLLRAPLLDWLHAVNRQTRRPVQPADMHALITSRLHAMLGEPRLAPAWHARAEAAARSLQQGQWQPVSVLMHSDLWSGNVLLLGAALSWTPGRVARGFRVIDWPGALEQGYPFFDLLRLAHSLGLSHRALAREVARHAAALGASPAHASHYLAAAYGQVLLTLENFPFERFNGMAGSCSEQLRAMGL